MRLNILQFACFCAILTVKLSNSHVFRIGYITGSRRIIEMTAYDRPGYQISGAISLAVNQINQQHPDGLLLNHTLEFEYAETYGEEAESIKHTARFCLANISAIIGPQETCFHEARLAAGFNTLMLTYYCQHAFKDKTKAERYSTFVTVKPPLAQISKSVASLLLKYNWRKITFVFCAALESGSRTAESIIRVLQDNGIQVLQNSWKTPEKFFFGFEGEEDVIFSSPFKRIVQETKDRTRIYVLVGTIDEHVGFMYAMEEEKLLDKGEYFVVGVYLEQYKSADPAVYLRGIFETVVAQKAIKAFRSFLAVIPTPRHMKFHEFNDEVNNWLPKPPFNFTWDDAPPKHVREEAAYLHDAVFMYARALNECLSNVTDCPNPHDGNKLVRYIMDKSYQSAMGYGGYIDDSGDAQGNYSLLALKEDPDRQVWHKVKQSLDRPTWNVGLADIGIFILSDNRSELPNLVLKDGEEIMWPFNVTPLDEPVCGFDNSKCPSAPEKDYRTITTVAIIGGVCALTFLLIFGLMGYKHWKYEQALASLLWKIEWKDLRVEGLLEYVKSTVDPDYDIHASLASMFNAVDIGHVDLRVTNLNTELGVYKKQLVAVKRIKKRHVDLTREVKKELKTMRELRHDNLCAFIGACTEPVCIVTEYCQRGSLKDILYDVNCALDDMFTASLIADMVKGMCCIHTSSLKSHGSLKPSNLLVDSRFVLKITDYGLHEFKRKTDGEGTHRPSKDTFRFETLLWTAPELLRTPFPPLEGTQAGDVYSFGVVLFEIYGRCGPFGRTYMTPREIVTEIKLTNLAEPFRPPFRSLVGVPDYVLSLIADCLNENPQSRPDFQAIKIRLKPMQRGMKPNIMDNVMSLLQRYANNLESLVGERTIQLQEEKKKTESLLYEILPRPVAEHLIKEERVEAEQFDCVTIFFSDIVGFTALSADSTPLEVVDFLNDLYTLFDSLLEHYDAYKVETIGDSYMVCSGLPIRNGNNHAGVVASMALHLVDAIKCFRIRHRPNQQLLLRIGIHSGPVVAGVVGMKMPRYCLFGDTVNTTSRFESTGEPQKIHCSPQCKLILDELGGYQLEPRGTVHMKGKGDLLTYWLVDEDEVNKQQRPMQDLSSVGDLNRASPILSKWGPQACKRRLSALRRPMQLTPSTSPGNSRRKLDTDSIGLGRALAITEENVQGSLPNIIASFAKDLKIQSGYYENGDIGYPLLGHKYNNHKSESQSANCSATGSREKLPHDYEPIPVA